MGWFAISLAALLSVHPSIRAMAPSGDIAKLPDPPFGSAPHAPRKLFVVISVRPVVPEPQRDPSYFGVIGVDGAGRPLDGKHRYRLHFERDGMPPRTAAWSLIALENDPFRPGPQAQGGILGHADRLQLNEDQSLDICLQRKPPPGAGVCNWLRTPPGRFNLVAHVRWPGAAEPDGDWKVPSIERRD
jgi:hypothetical protein